MIKAKILCGLMAILSILSIGGCAKESQRINDFSWLSSLKQDQTNRIEVCFDNYSGATFRFTIEEQADIDEIMNIIFSSTFIRMPDGLHAGCNTSITIIQGEKKYGLNVMTITEGRHNYKFETTELSDKISELARKAGAFDGKN